MLRRFVLLAAIPLCTLAGCSSSGHKSAAAVGTPPTARTTAATPGVDRLLPTLTRLRQYAATSEEVQVIVENQASSILPTFLQGSDTSFVGDGTVGASVDFSSLTAADLQVSPDEHAVNLKLPHAQLTPAAVDPHKSY